MKKKRISFLLAALVAVNLLSGCVNNTENKTETKQPAGGYVNLDAGYTDVKVVDEKSAIQAVESVKEQLGIANVDEDVKVTQTQEIDQSTYYRMQQMYQDIPVYGKNVILVADESGKSPLLSANTISVDKGVNTEAKISLEDAKKSIQSYVEETLGYSAQATMEMLAADPELVFYELEDASVKLAYDIYVNVSGKEGSTSFEALIDAENGSLLLERSSSFEESVASSGKDVNRKKREFQTEKISDSKYVMHDSERQLHIYNAGDKTVKHIYLDKDGTPADAIEDFAEIRVCDEDGASIDIVSNKKNRWSDKKAVTVMANLKDSYSFFQDVFQLKGVAGKNLEVHAYYNDRIDGETTNAYANSSGRFIGEIYLGFGTKNTLAIDVIGHEYMHGVEQATVGMLYQGESGAIMEAYSDIFGELIEDYADNQNLDGSCDWIMNPKGFNRSIKDPLSSESPATYKGDKWYSGKEDHGGVHRNSTVLSHAAYLMANESDGMGAQKLDHKTLANLWFRTLQIMFWDSNFDECAARLRKTADLMFQEGSLTAEQKQRVELALDAVGLKTQQFVEIGKGSVLFAVDAAGELYDNYHVVIEKVDDSGVVSNKDSVVEKVDVFSEDGYPLKLEDGKYLVTLTDLNEENLGSKFTEYIHYRKDAGALDIFISTNFNAGDLQYLADYSVPEEQIMIIGEVGVIEPELELTQSLPDAKFSFHFTSSNEEVATVTSRGEAGIVQAKAKGETIITTSIDVKGRKIEKTTKVRVTSKGRDTVLVLDISGSMFGTPMEEMKKAAIDFCESLLVDEYNNRVGLVFYDDAIVNYSLTDDLNYLISQIEAVSLGDLTNMEAAVAEASRMLQSEGRIDSIKNMVVMADGLPNTGATLQGGELTNPYYDVKCANAVLETAKDAMSGCNMYSLGFYHSLSGSERDFAEDLMSRLTNMPEGYYVVEEAENLEFAFGDISETISDGSKIVINIACPVEVDVTYNGEVLSSLAMTGSQETSFGTVQRLGKNQDIKVVTLDADKEYDVNLTGTGDGAMDYSINYLNENEEVEDYREFSSIPITPTTTILTSTDNSEEDVALNVDNDGDGEIDMIWSAKKNSTATITYDSTPQPGNMGVWQVCLLVFAILVICGGILIVILVLGKGISNKTENAEEEIPIRENPVKQRQEQKTEKREEEAGCEHYIEILTGSMKGIRIPVADEKMFYLGKDPKQTNLCFSNDYQAVSRLHCTVIYSEQYGTYYVTDCSMNGTYYMNKKRLTKGKRIAVPQDSILLLANEQAKIMLK